MIFSHFHNGVSVGIFKAIFGDQNNVVVDANVGPPAFVQVNVIESGPPPAASVNKKENLARSAFVTVMKQSTKVTHAATEPHTVSTPQPPPLSSSSSSTAAVRKGKEVKEFGISPKF